MNNLQVFNSEVIPVYTTDTGERVVIGRELHEGLNIVERYSKWFSRMCDYGFKEDEDYTPYQMVHPQNHQTIDSHILKLDMAKHIAMIQRTPQGKATRDKLIALETHVAELSPQLQLLINLEVQQRRQQQELEEVNQKVDDIRCIAVFHPTSWRKEARQLITGIAQAMGGLEYIQNVNAEVYSLLEERAKVRLQTRLTNKRRVMADNGVCKSKRDKLNKMDVIAEDAKLIEIYVAIVKEMAIKYDVSFAKKGA